MSAFRQPASRPPGGGGLTIWLDAQLSPLIADWIAATFSYEAVPVRALGLLDAADGAIFEAARQADVIVLTKDRDFVDLVERHGPPPRVIWLTCGNTSNTRLRTLLAVALPPALQALDGGEALVEIGDVRG